MYDNIRAVEGRGDHEWTEGIVDDERHSSHMRELRQGWEIGDDEGGIRKALDEENARPILECGLHFLRVGDVDEGRPDPRPER